MKMVIERRLTILLVASGTAELIPVGLLRTNSIRDEDEPVFLDSLLHLHNN